MPKLGVVVNGWGRCERCNNELMGGSHYHCGGCDSDEVTGMLGHYSYGKMTCQLSPDELEAHNKEHRFA